MHRLFIVVLLLFVGCGSDTPVGPEPEPEPGPDHTTGDLVVENVNDTSSESGQIKKKKNKKKSKKKKRRKNSDTSKADNDSLSDEKSFKKARYVYDYEENRKFVAEKDNGNDNLKFEENKFQMDLGLNKSERKYSNFKRGESEEKEPGETSD